MAQQPIRHPQVGGAIREALERQGIEKYELAEKLGLARSNPTPYNWINGINAPTSKYRKKLAKILDIREVELMPGPTVRLNGPSPPSPVPAARAERPSEHFSWVILSDGQARLRVDITGPRRDLFPLARSIQDLMDDQAPKRIGHEP